jgi:hypothetical protein
MDLQTLWAEAREAVGDRLETAFDEDMLTDAANHACEETFRVLGIGYVEQTLTGPYSSTVPVGTLRLDSIDSVRIP